MENKKVFYLKAKRFNVKVGGVLSVLLNEEEAWLHGIRAIDKVGLLYETEDGMKEVVVEVDLSKDLLDHGEIGITDDVYDKYKIDSGDVIGIRLSQRNPLSVSAVKKCLFGKKLSEEEIRVLVKDMADNRISDTLITYYAASSFFYKSRRKELYYTAKASAEYGNTLKFDGISAVKYCIGGVPGNETTMILAPIISSLGIKFPKTFSKAITSPAATGECVETLMDIEFKPREIEQIVDKVGCCLAWGKNLGLAPANDRIIKVAYPISMEAYSKMVVSIAAKIYAGGVSHCLIDIPVGPTAKIKAKKVAKRIKGHFEYIGKHLGMKTKVVLTDGTKPIGRGIGGVLQVREVLRILQQHPLRSEDLEKKAIMLGGELLKLTGKYRRNKCYDIVQEQLTSGKAWVKMKEIIKAQNGKDNIGSEDLNLAKYTKSIVAKDSGHVRSIDLRYLTDIARTLGAPLDKQAGLYLDKQVGEKFDKGDILFTLYSNDQEKIKFVEDMLSERELFVIK